MKRPWSTTQIGPAEDRVIGPLSYHEALDQATLRFKHVIVIPYPRLYGTQNGTTWNTITPENKSLTDRVAWCRERFGAPAMTSMAGRNFSRSYVMDTDRYWAYFSDMDEYRFLFRTSNAAMEFKLRWI